jgi:hypothetical protein
MSDLELYADLSTRTLVAKDGSTLTLPTLVLGDQCICSLKILDRIDGGDLTTRDLNVRTLRASIGSVLTTPTEGAFTLRFDGDPSATLSPGTPAAEMEAAIENLDPNGTYQLQEVTASVPGCWLLRFGSTGAIPLAVATNTLQPESFVRIRAFEQSGQRWHEIRLIQTPVVFTGTYERVLPPPPTITRIRSGNSQGDFQVDEIQALIVPSNFNGTYYLAWNFRTTKLLGIDDGPDQIAAALNAMFADGASRFTVSNPEPDYAYIDFGGDLAGTPQPLITVTVHSFQPGVLTFTLDLARAELASALRGVAQIELPFEVELEVVDNDQDAADPAVPGRLITLFQKPITIERELIWDELADIPAIDWMRPPQPRDYIPFTRDQIITGAQHYVAVIGDGARTSIQLDHNLGTAALHLTVRENKGNGRRLFDNEFELHFPSNNEAVLDFPAGSAPAVNGLVVTITTAGPISAFQNHTHTIAQIIGLQDALFALGARLAAIEDLLPTVQPTLPAANTQPLQIQLPDRTEVFPGKLPAGFDPKSLSSNAPVTTAMPRAAGLLPAIHNVTVRPIAAPLPPAAANAGKVFQNNTASPLLVPGGLGRRGAYLEASSFAGSDGRVWYRLTHVAATTSYFPTDFERELFLFHVNEQMLRAGQALTLEFDLALQLLQATGAPHETRGQYLLVIELGSAPSQTTPAPTAENLLDVQWQDTPLLSQRLIVSSLQLKHHFGANIRRDINGNLLADRLLYNVWAGGAPTPAGPNFVVRARLIQWDTENSVRSAKGNVFYAFTGAKASIA